jgi:hypothetical protein
MEATDSVSRHGPICNTQRDIQTNHINMDMKRTTYLSVTNIWSNENNFVAGKGSLTFPVLCWKSSDISFPTESMSKVCWH